MSNNKTLKIGKSNMKNSLNKIYRLVWSTIKSAWVPVAESAKARGKGGSRAMAALLLTAGLTFAGGAQAIDWIGTTGEWVNGTNWSGGARPLSTESAVIENGGTAQLNTTATANVIQVGLTGSGTLAISDFGTLFTNFGGIIGNGSVTVDGTGTLLSNSPLEVGYIGTGSLSITNGGTVQGTIGRIANQIGSQGTVTVDGPDSNWGNTELYVGVSGTGLLEILNGGAVSNVTGFIGFGPTSEGTVNVTGSSSEWVNSSDFYVGYDGDGTLNISNGGLVRNINASIGENTDSTGTVNVTGTDSTWRNRNLSVGSSGNGTLNITSGGTVFITAGVIGLYLGGEGTVTVDGENSTLNNRNSLSVGASGTGTLNIINGGTVTNTNSYIGQNTDGTGTVNVNGIDSTWTNTDVLLVGNDGNGTLNITNRGTVISAFSSIGEVSGSTGTVTVDGTGSTWTNDRSLSVGYEGNGTLNILNGGAVSNTYGYIGGNADGAGTVNVDGADSSWTNSDELSVGRSATGTLNITNGGTVSNFGNAFIGHNSGSTGTVTVSGAGSTWTNNVAVFVGADGNGTLNITNGGAVSNTYGYIGVFSDGTGTTTVDGAGSTWTNTADLYVGFVGNGTLNIRNGGNVSATGTVYIAEQSGSTGTLNIGATLGSAAVAAGTLNAGLVRFGSGTGALVFNHTATDYDFTSGIEGTGAIGLYSGTTKFTGSLSGYTGTMTVDGGTLNIADGSTLQIGGQYTQTADGTLKIGASSASSFGKLDVTGQATFASGTGLNVNVASTNTLANGNKLTNVVQAGNLTASTFNVTDNSALFNFTASVTEGGNGHIDLNTVAAGSTDPTDPTPADPITVLSSVQHTGFGPGKGAARVLDTFVQGGTTGTDMDNVVTALGQLSTEQAVSNAVAQTLPLMSAGLTSVAMNTMRSNNRVIQARQDSNHGLSSGEDFLGNKKVWFKPLGANTQQDNREGVSGYRANTYGFIAGADGELNEATRIGVALSYMNSNVDGKSTASGNRADIDAYQAIVYGSHSLSNLSDTEVIWQADIGFNKNNGHRNINFGGLNRVAKGDYDSTTAHIGAGIARNYKLDDKTTITPVVRADYTYIRDESYTETGAGALNLKVKSHSIDELIVLAEGRLSHKFSDKAALIANAGVGYDILNGKNSITASYTGGGAAFSTEGMDVSPWLGRAGLGLAVNVTETIDIAARYDMEARSDFLNQTASAKVRWAF